MVRKETCPHCKGDRYIKVKNADGRPAHVKCPHCGGQGYRVRLTN